MSFDVALSGLSAATQHLNVISHNIANVNTTGFKASRASFSDVYAATQTGLSRNAIGKGVTLRAVDQQFSQGNIRFTESNLDLAVSGPGFFRLNDGGSTVYSRAGEFGLDREGFFVNGSGHRLTGFLANQGNITGALGDLQVSTSDFPPTPTTEVAIGVNLDATESAIAAVFDKDDPATYNDSTSTTVYDSLGTSHVVTMYFQKTNDNEWATHMLVDGVQLTPSGGNSITFNTDGSLDGPSPPEVPFDPQAVGGGADPLVLTLDVTDLTQYGTPFSVKALTQDGFPTGRLTDIDIDQTGVIFSRFSNGLSNILGQVALASFANPQGLQQLGDTNWGETFSSGAALTGAPGSSSLGLVESGAVEEANVDLTSQLVEMITAQRNFQANAQVISTNDTVTQTIINIR